MAWLQLTLDSNRQAAEQLSELLQQFGAISVSLTAISDEALFDRHSGEADALWQQTRINALLPEDADLDVLLPLLRQRAGATALHNHHIDYLPDKDWLGEYRQLHDAQLFAGKLCICPGWRTPPAAAEYVLYLDPGLAFGTGNHETTAMCLEWLAGRDLQQRYVIDYGCGSGILALSAVLLGARHVCAVDIDPQAIEATRANAERNVLQSQLTLSLAEQMPLTPADVLVANILLNPLLALAPRMAELVKAGGELALSGILSSQVDVCLAAYSRWFTMQTPVYNREWALLTGVRN